MPTATGYTLTATTTDSFAESVERVRAELKEEGFGVLCENVVVYQRDGETHISAVDAERMLSIVGNDQLAPTAATVRAKLTAGVERASATD